MAKKTLKYILTEKHCKNSDFADRWNCPIAKLLKEKGHTDVLVWATYVDIDNSVYNIDEYKGSSLFIRPLIEMANEGKRFKRTITFIEE